MWRRRPLRHLFFVRIFILLFFICTIALIVSLFSSGPITVGRVLGNLGWTVLIISFAFFLLKRAFIPMRILLEGVQEISNGNLDFQIPVRIKRQGEISFLANQFNFMARRVKEMVASKDRLLADVSHELRSPLTRMKVALEMTPKSRQKDSMMRDLAEMESMVAEILETQRLKSGYGKLTLKPVDLTGLVKDLIRNQKGRKPDLVLIGKPAPILIKADEARVKTVILNVVENALKYSSNQKRPVEVKLERTGKGIEVAIQDHGEGIPKAELGKVFEPFYRVDKSRAKATGGYGLGLSLCKEIMLAHGGEIRLKSSVGKGTEIRLIFPKIVDKDKHQ